MCVSHPLGRLGPTDTIALSEGYTDIPYTVTQSGINTCCTAVLSSAPESGSLDSDPPFGAHAPPCGRVDAHSLQLCFTSHITSGSQELDRRKRNVEVHWMAVCRPPPNQDRWIRIRPLGPPLLAAGLTHTASLCFTSHITSGSQSSIAVSVTHVEVHWMAVCRPPPNQDRWIRIRPFGPTPLLAAGLTHTACNSASLHTFAGTSPCTLGCSMLINKVWWVPQVVTGQAWLALRAVQTSGSQRTIAVMSSR